MIIKLAIDSFWLLRFGEFSCCFVDCNVYRCCENSRPGCVLLITNVWFAAKNESLKKGTFKFQEFLRAPLVWHANVNYKSRITNEGIFRWKKWIFQRTFKWKMYALKDVWLSRWNCNGKTKTNSAPRPIRIKTDERRRRFLIFSEGWRCDREILVPRG